MEHFSNVFEIVLLAQKGYVTMRPMCLISSKKLKENQVQSSFHLDKLITFEEKLDA